MNYLIGKLIFWSNKILKRHPYFHSKVIAKYESRKCGGLGVFILRGKSVELGLLPSAEFHLIDVGFELVDSRILNDNEINLMSKKTRGSDWGDELPAAIIVVFDRYPKRLTGASVSKNPDMDNNRLLEKHKIRKLLNSKLDSFLQTNVMHSTDNSYQAWKYISLISNSYKKYIYIILRKRFAIR